MSEEKGVEVKINRDRYTASRTASGTKSLSNGDDVAKVLEGLPVESLYSICDILIADNDFSTKYAKLNHGMQRMNLGNRLRGFVSKRDAENETIRATAEKDGKEPKLKNSGLEAITKAAAPFRKEADKAAAEAAKAKEAKAKEAAKAKAEKEAAKTKKSTTKKGKAA